MIWYYTRDHWKKQEPPQMIAAMSQTVQGALSPSLHRSYFLFLVLDIAK